MCEATQVLNSLSWPAAFTIVGVTIAAVWALFK